MVQAATSSPRQWSTSTVAAPQRLDYWIGAISEGFLAMDVSAKQRDFNGSLTSAPLDVIGVNAVEADAQKVWRTPHAIARAPERYCYLLGNLDRRWKASQDGRDALLEAGDFVLVDARRPYHFDFAQGVNVVSLELPLEWVTHWLAEPERHVAQPFRRSEPGWGAALSAFASPWKPALAVQPPLQPRLLADQLGALLALACQPVAATRPDRMRVEQIEDAIRQRLCEPGLTAADVAGALGISVRSLHRTMAAHQQTFAQVLLAERLRRAQQMLQTPRLAHVSVAEVGRRVGLQDPSHFSRLCRRWLGTSPRALRVT